MNDEAPESTGRISRRQILQWAGAGLLVNAAGTLLYDPIGRLSMPLNEAVEALFLSSKPTPEFPISAIEPELLIVNSFRGTPKIDLANFQLKISGEVADPLSLNMAEIQKLPVTSMVIRQVCVEGWAAIVQWGGVRLQDLLKIAQPRSSAKYVYFKSADGYYESWDLASVLHPQTFASLSNERSRSACRKWCSIKLGITN